MADRGPGNNKDFLARFQAGDSEAFTLIYRLHSPAVFRFALHMSGDRMKAEEITQDVFVWLMHYPGSYDPSRGDLGPFLIGVTRKFLQRLLRSERKWIPFDEAKESRASWPPGSGSSPSEAVDRRAALLRDAISRLPIRYREVVVLCDLEGSTYEAAAGALECAVGTVRSRLHRARELLGRKLQAKVEVQRCEV